MTPASKPAKARARCRRSSFRPRLIESAEPMQKGPSAATDGPLNVRRLSGFEGSNRMCLLVGGDGAGLVVVDVEDGVELGQLQQVVDLLRELEQLEMSALIL